MSLANKRRQKLRNRCSFQITNDGEVQLTNGSASYWKSMPSANIMTIYSILILFYNKRHFEAMYQG